MIFNVNDYVQIDRNVREDDIFANAADSPYLTALSNIINNIRYTRQPFLGLKILLAGVNEDEQIVSSLCICDENSNYRYKMDYNKYMQKVQTHGVQGTGLGLQK